MKASATAESKRIYWDDAQKKELVDTGFELWRVAKNTLKTPLELLKLAQEQALPSGQRREINTIQAAPWFEDGLLGLTAKYIREHAEMLDALVSLRAQIEKPPELTLEQKKALAAEVLTAMPFHELEGLAAKRKGEAVEASWFRIMDTYERIEKLMAANQTENREQFKAQQRQISAIESRR